MNVMQPRRLLLAGALLLTLAAMYLVDTPDSDEDLTMPRATPRKPSLRLPSDRPDTTQLAPTGEQALPDLARSRARQIAVARQGDAQGHTHAGVDLWQAKLEPVAQPSSIASHAESAEAALPVVPPLPYQYMGQMDDAPGGNLVFLTSRNRVFSVSPGQIVEQVWRLDKLDAQALYLTYLPLNTTVVLSKTAKQVVAAHSVGTEDQPTDR
ncbi:hypothetical protein LG204_12245 [Methylovorus menthalis]|uniref:hypothetical protein n=1 Tax=Methylovorus menthalis TaxID=1002227 RepID=UPI001E57F1AD|nr:hypothetical protein [Methylovorus menthalis]MCB4812085.1 hypothetical protein [Methylovorus menthalis]